MTLLRPGITTLVLASLVGVARADLKPAPIFSDHMVLQQGRPVPVFGTATAGERITVMIGDRRWEGTAAKDGQFRVDIGPLTQHEPFTVEVRGASNTVRFTDVVAGEVWIASGQSNMEWPVIAAQNAEAEILAANFPRVRLFNVKRPDPTRLSDQPVPVEAQWEVASPKTAPLFSAIGYFFGRDLSRRLDRPVGIIHSSWGGTLAEAWTSRAALLKNPRLKHLVTGQPKPPTDEAVRAYKQALGQWNAETTSADRGNEGVALGYAKPESPGLGWLPIRVPGAWEDVANVNIDGAVWFRRQVTLPRAFVGQDVTLRLGAIDTCDVTYVAGEQIGATCRETPQTERWPRVYKIPARLTKTGSFILAIRVFDERGKGGLIGPESSMKIVLGENTDGASLSLAGGDWTYRIERELPSIPNTRRGRPNAPAGMRTQNSPGALYDNMLVTMAPFGVAGAIWYQGESNTKRAAQYRTLLPAMIDNWRAVFGQGAFPFLIVQLANYHPRFAGSGQRSEDEWAELREAQAQVAAKHPKCGLAVTYDIGDRNDIHPTNKQEVGRRLALVALGQVYGQAVDASGPVFSRLKIEKDKARVSFDHADGLAASAPNTDKLLGFEVAGADRRYVSADARIEGGSIILTANTVPKPVAVRYAWTDDPSANLINHTGLPAVPFRSDTWPGLTAGRK